MDKDIATAPDAEDRDARHSRLLRLEDLAPAVSVGDQPETVIEFGEHGLVRCTKMTRPNRDHMKAATGEPDALPTLGQRIVKAMLRIESVAKDAEGVQSTGNKPYASVDVVTRAGGFACASEGVVFWVNLLSTRVEKWEFEHTDGLRLSAVYEAVMFSSDDPADCVTCELEVACNATGDKHHQVLEAIARKLAFLRLLNIPRGNEDDAESQPNPGHGKPAGRRSSQPSSGGGGGDPVAEVQRLMEAGDREGAEKIIAGLKGGQGTCSEGQSGRIYGIAKSHGWQSGPLEMMVGILLGVEITKDAQGRNALRVGRDAYNPLCAYLEFDYVPKPVPKKDTSPKQGAPPTVGAKTFEDAWLAIYTMLPDLPDGFEALGEGGAAKVIEGLCRETDWTEDQIREVVEQELGVEVEELPIFAVKPAVLAAVKDAFRNYGPGDLPRCPPYKSEDEPRGPLTTEPVGWKKSGKPASTDLERQRVKIVEVAMARQAEDWDTKLSASELLALAKEIGADLTNALTSTGAGKKLPLVAAIKRRVKAAEKGGKS